MGRTNALPISDAHLAQLREQVRTRSHVPSSRVRRLLVRFDNTVDRFREHLANQSTAAGDGASPVAESDLP